VAPVNGFELTGAWYGPCRQPAGMDPNTCPSCGTERAEPDGACDACGAPERVASAPDTPTGAAAPASVEDGAAAPVPRAAGGRELLLIALAVAGGAAVTFAMLPARPDPSSVPAPDEPVVTRETDAPAPVRAWSAANSAAWIGSLRNAAAIELEADNTIDLWTRTIRPSLVVRCARGSVEVFVFTQSAARIEAQTDDHTVTYSFDDGEEITERWPDSDDHDALFAPDGRAFARRLASAGSWRFSFHPHNAPRATMTFRVAGLDDAMAPMVRPCGGRL
jgi:hypothetical protein